MKPTNIVLHQASNVLEISFESGETFKLSCEYLRVVADTLNRATS